MDRSWRPQWAPYGDGLVRATPKWYIPETTRLSAHVLVVHRSPREKISLSPRIFLRFRSAPLTPPAHPFPPLPFPPFAPTQVRSLHQKRTLGGARAHQSAPSSPGRAPRLRRFINARRRATWVSEVDPPLLPPLCREPPARTTVNWPNLRNPPVSR